MRAYYDDSVENFLSQKSTNIIGTLTSNSDFDVTQFQRDAWGEQIDILQEQLSLNPEFKKYHIFFEFTIPRMGSRIDVVLFIPTDKPHLILLEFKVGAMAPDASAREQVMDYALELKNFHKGSHKADIFPAVIATGFSEENNFNTSLRDGISEVSILTSDSICEFIEEIEFTYSANDPAAWENTPYEPTPTIIEAARALWRDQNVEEITRSEGGAINITKTCAKVNELIEDAKGNNKKKIIFVTGVPGAGKTLVGLNIAAGRRKDDGDHAVLLSGNGPLVAVLQESLARDEVERSKAEGASLNKKEALTKVKSFVQIVHHYRDESIKNPEAPSEHIAIFDEAQRLWNEKALTDFMKRKKGIPDFNKSEGGALIEYLDRHDNWACCVCLVGGGQEINTGEAGIGAWIEAVKKDFHDWEICISPNLRDSEYKDALSLSTSSNVTINEYEELHLAVSMRSFRAEKVSNFVKALLDIEKVAAQDLARELNEYPIVITRDLATAKKWVRAKARGSERYGMIASSKALRLKPFAVDINSKPNPVHYFLGGKDDTRSSFFLESVASEFEVQGLELDYAIVCWDGDFRFKDSGEWEYKNFTGNKWTEYNNTDIEPNRRDFLKNAYRVLLTRARQGMVIFVPLGNYPPDETRRPEFYDGTYNYLKSLGLKEIGGNDDNPFVDKGY